MDDDPRLLPLLVTAAAAAAATALLLYRKMTSEKKQLQSCGCACSCSAGAVPDPSLPNGDGKVVVSGASMMEQLVPEITTHTLSYLDFVSLCRLSMTNSAMRRAANDDGAWKALYHKDFTLEQDSITPINGWKSYYATTKAIVNINAEFYNIIRERSLPAMSRFWLQADYVKCVHGTGELYMGYSRIMDNWAVAFNWEQGAQGVVVQIRDVRARVLTDMAWVTMKAYANADGGPFHVTNVFEFHNGRWYMVHHHSSAGLIMHGLPEMLEA